MEHAVERTIHFERPANIPLPELEQTIALQVLNIGGIARNEVVDAHHIVAFRNQPVTKMRADETGGARHYESQIDAPMHLS